VPGQFGEELVLDEVFAKDFVGTAIDVGACDGLFLNITYPLEQRGWTVLCIEPNPLYEPHLRKNRKLVQAVACSDYEAEESDFTIVEMTEGQGYWSAVSALRPNEEQMEAHRPLIRATQTVKVPVKRLESCIAEAKLQQVDLLSIDTEGEDLKVLDGFNVAKWLPKCIMIENWKDDSTFETYLRPYGYGAKVRLGVNDIFVRV